VEKAAARDVRKAVALDGPNALLFLFGPILEVFIDGGLVTENFLVRLTTFKKKQTTTTILEASTCFRRVYYKKTNRTMYTIGQY
jgi:hypothetical protein